MRLTEQLNPNVPQVFLDNERPVEGEYKGKKVMLNQPFATGDPEIRFAVYVKNKKGAVVKVRFSGNNQGFESDDPATPAYWNSKKGKQFTDSKGRTLSIEQRILKEIEEYEL